MQGSKLSKINTILLVLIMIFNERLLDLVKFKNTVYIDITIIIIIFMFFINIIAIISRKSFDFQYPIILMFFLMIVTALISKLYLNQSSVYILKAYRHMLYYLLYFPLIIYLKNKVNYRFVQNLLISFGLLFSVLVIIEAISGGTGIILKGANFANRNGVFRYYIGFSLVIPAFFLCLANLFKNITIRYKIFSMLVVIVGFYYFSVIAKSRNTVFAVVAATVIVLLAQKKYKYTNKYVVLIIMGAGTIFLFKDTLGELLALTLNDTTGTGQVRIDFIKYILLKIKDSPILGLGMYAPEFELVPYEVHVDVGIFGFLFEFGIVGLLWGTVMVKMAIKRIIYIYRNKTSESYFFIGYIVYSLVVMPFNCMFNLREALLYFIIVCALVEVKYKELI